MRNKTYTTKSGDMWDMISLEVYGSELFVDDLMRANFEHRNVTIFNAGVTLNVPEISPMQLDNTNLPPWRRSNG